MPSRKGPRRRYKTRYTYTVLNPYESRYSMGLDGGMNDPIGHHVRITRVVDRLTPGKAGVKYIPHCTCREWSVVQECPTVRSAIALWRVEHANKILKMYQTLPLEGKY